MPRFDLSKSLKSLKLELSQKPQRANEEVEEETDKIFIQYMEQMVDK